MQIPLQIIQCAVFGSVTEPREEWNHLELLELQEGCSIK